MLKWSNPSSGQQLISLLILFSIYFWPSIHLEDSFTPVWPTALFDSIMCLFLSQNILESFWEQHRLAQLAASLHKTNRKLLQGL